MLNEKNFFVRKNSLSALPCPRSVSQHPSRVRRCTLPPYCKPRSRLMTTRRTACSCWQLHLTIDGEPSRISMCHCLACQRRTGKRPHPDLSFLSDMRLYRLLGERRLSRNRHRCHRQLRRPVLPRADHRGVGGITPPLGFFAVRHAGHARDEAGVTTGVLLPGVDLLVRYCPKADIRWTERDVR
jgi:hypothetical protein